MMSQLDGKEQNNFKSFSSQNLGSHTTKISISMEVDQSHQIIQESKSQKVLEHLSEPLSHDKKHHVNIDKIIRENSDTTQMPIEVENEGEVNETSTCPSKKLKMKKDKYEDDLTSSSSDSESCSPSNSSYHNKKRKRKHSRSRSRKNKRRRERKNERESSRRRRSHSKKRRHRSSSRVRRHTKGKDVRKERKRHSRSKSPSSNTSEATLKKKNYFEERRKARNKSRSNSALRVMKLKNLENASGYYQRYYQRPHEDNDPKKPQLYWDGYQWVIRPNQLSEQSFDIIKPGRKVQIANVPLHLNIQVNLFKDFLINKIVEKNVISKKDVKVIDNIIRGIELDYDNNTAVIAMESTEIAKRMVLLDGLILLGHTLRFSPYHDINSENNSKEVSSLNIAKASALANSAHLSAKSAAIAYAALKSLGNVGNKQESVLLNLAGDIQTTMPSSKVVKVMNLVDPKEVPKLNPERFEEILDDIKDEFNKIGNVVMAVIINPKLEKIGAEAASVFVEFLETKFAENCLKIMKGKRYEAREIKLAYIDENVFKKEIL